MQVSQAIAERHGLMFETLNYRKDGLPFRNAVMIAPTFDAAGELAYILGSQVALSGGQAGTASAQERAAAARRRLKCTAVCCCSD